MKISMVPLLAFFFFVPFLARGETSSAPKNSIYQLDMSLTDQEGRISKLDVFKGQPVVISMFYTSCPMACPMLIDTIKKIEGSLTPAEKDGLRVLLVSFDPKHDTVAQLKEISVRHRLDSNRWRLARASDDQVRQLSHLLKIKYKQTSENDFDHSSILTLLDENGAILLSKEGLNSEIIKEITSKLKSLRR